MGKVRFYGKFDWYGAPALPHMVDKEGKLYAYAYTEGGATASIMSRIATNLKVSLSKVVNYYKDHPNAFKVGLAPDVVK